MTQSRNIVGAGLIMLINGRVIGEATSFNYVSSTPSSSAPGLDQNTPFELIPLGAEVSGNIGVLRRHASGGLQGRGITAPIPRLAEQRYFSLLIVNRFDQTTFFRADHCLVQQEQWEVPARGRVQGSFAFKGIMWSNEIEPFG